METKFDFNVTDTYYYVDSQYHMMLQINQLWDPTGDNGKGDSIGRTFEAYYTYNDERFVEAVKSCWIYKTENNEYYYKGRRFPDLDDNTMSRDHLFNTILILIESGYSETELNEFVTHVPWKISDKYNQTLDLWLWMRSVSGIWWAQILSPIVDISLMTFTVIWQKLLYTVASFQQELSQDEFIIAPKVTKTKWMKFIGNMLYPSYTMTQYAWKLHYMKKSVSKRVLTFLLLKITNKHNYVVRLLLNDPNEPTREQIYSYKSMMGGRWDGILNPEINDRDMHIIDSTRYCNYEQLLSANVLDVDLVRRIYKNKNNI